MAAKRTNKAPAKKAAAKKAPATTAVAKKAAAKKAADNGEPKTFDPDGLTEHVCIICNRRKPVAMFYRHSNGRRNTRCRLCGAVIRGKLTNAEAEARWEKQQASGTKPAPAKAPAKKAAARKAAGK